MEKIGHMAGNPPALVHLRLRRAAGGASERSALLGGLDRGIDFRDCLEKNDLVEKLASSPPSSSGQGWRGADGRLGDRDNNFSGGRFRWIFCHAFTEFLFAAITFFFARWLAGRLACPITIFRRRKYLYLAENAT